MIVSNDRVVAFVAKTCRSQIVPPYTAFGVERGGEIVSGAVFTNWTGADVHITVAGSVWTKGILADVGAYVYGKLGCLRMTVVTEQPKVVRLTEKLGGEVEGLLRNHFGPDRHAFIVGILKNDWPY